MADAPTRTDLIRVGRTAALAIPGALVPPEEFDREGSDANLINAASAFQGEEVVAFMLRAMRDLFVDTAKGEGLDKLAFDRYGLTRKPAARSRVTLNFTRPDASGGAGTLLKGHRARSADGVIVELTEPVEFSLSLTTTSGPARALIAGIDGNVALSTLTTFLDGPFDSTLTVTNRSVAAGGADREEGDDFRRRIKEFLPSVRRGTAEAIEFGAKSVAGVATARTREFLDGTGQPACRVELFILDDSGGSNNLLEQAVRDTLLRFRALGINVIVTGGVVVLTPIALVLTFEAGIDTQTASVRVRDTIVALVNDLKIGQTLAISLISAAAHSVRGVLNAVVTIPVGDVVPQDKEAIRTSTALVTIA